MCMKYVNANVQCFNNSSSQLWFGNGGLSSFIKSVNCVKRDNGRYQVEKFGIAIFVNIRGSENDKQNNPLEQKKVLEFKIRLTKTSTQKDRQLSYDLASFTINLSDRDLIQTACFDYIDLIKVVNVNELELEATGDYVIKVLVREQGEDFYDIQMTHSLIVNESK